MLLASSRLPAKPRSPGLLALEPVQGLDPPESCRVRGNQALVGRVVELASAGASPLAAVGVGVERASGAMGQQSRDLGPRIKAAVAASAELQERDALKSVGMAAAMPETLVARGVPEPVAQVAGELGVLAFKRGFAAWSDGDRQGEEDLARHALAALDELRAAAGALG